MGPIAKLIHSSTAYREDQYEIFDAPQHIPNGPAHFNPTDMIMAQQFAILLAYFFMQSSANIDTSSGGE